jgi:CRISPR-associated protein (TIGR02584 family)
MGLAEPESFARRTLLLVTGAEPWVLSQTVRYLTQKAETRFIPTDIRVLATKAAAQHLRRALLSPDTDWLRLWRDDFALSLNAFGVAHIHVIPTRDGETSRERTLSDTEESAAEFILDTVRRLAEDETRAIHATIAGSGRNFAQHLHYALSLFGRPQDKLTYAIMSPERGSGADLFHLDPADQELDTDASEIHFVEIPFVRLAIKSSPHPKS